MKPKPNISEIEPNIGKHEQTAQNNPPLTVMAIQDLLGLFSPKADTEEKERHDYLKKKPLGLI